MCLNALKTIVFYIKIKSFEIFVEIVSEIKEYFSEALVICHQYMYLWLVLKIIERQEKIRQNKLFYALSFNSGLNVICVHFYGLVGSGHNKSVFPFVLIVRHYQPFCESSNRKNDKTLIKRDISNQSSL